MTIFDILGSYLVKLSTQGINEEESAASGRLLHISDDLERIADHCCNIAECMLSQPRHLRWEDASFRKAHEFYAEKYLNTL